MTVSDPSWVSNLSPAAKAKYDFLIQEIKDTKNKIKHRTSGATDASSGFPVFISPYIDLGILSKEITNLAPVNNPNVYDSALTTIFQSNSISLNDAELAHSQLSVAHFAGAQMKGASFHGAMLVRTHFYSLGPSKVSRFDNADFQGANLGNVSAKGAVFIGAKFGGAKMTGSDFRETSIENAHFDSSTIFSSNTRLQKIKVGNGLYLDYKFTASKKEIEKWFIAKGIQASFVSIT